MTDRAAVLAEARRLHADMIRVTGEPYAWSAALRWAWSNAHARRSNVDAQMAEIRAAIEAIAFDPATCKYGRK